MTTNKRPAETRAASEHEKIQDRLARPEASKDLPKAFDKTHKALSITEILEDILIHIVDPWDLLSARDASSTFRQTINTSDKLQKKLFIKPATSFEEVKRLGMVTHDSLILCPGRTSPDVEGGFAVFNPFILDVTSNVREGCVIKLRNNVLYDTVASRRRLSLWGTMYISQPPPLGEIETLVSYRYTVEDYVLGIPEDGFGGHDQVYTTSPFYHIDTNERICDIMDQVEDFAMYVRGCVVKWESVKLGIPGDAVCNKDPEDTDSEASTDDGNGSD